jgi:hypothetical protein
MLLFSSEAHIDEWCTMWNQPRGATLTLQQGWGLANAWYSADRRGPDWRRKTVDEAESIFSGLGLTSPFWNLPR